MQFLKNHPTWLLLTLTLVGLLAVGVPYWAIPYNRLNLPSSLIGAGLIVVFVLSLLPRVTVGTRFVATWLLVGSSVPAAVVVRVVYDLSVFPTSHNLWPFEVLIAASVGYVIAFAGAALGALLKRAVGGSA